MFARRSIKLPIILGVVMIILLVALIVGWVLLAVIPLGDDGYAPLYWTLLFVGTTFLVLVLMGVIMYLAVSIKAINLNRRQSNFIDSVTHELKSPIASLKLYLQTLNRREVDRQEQLRFYQIMLEDVERLDHLINHVLDAGSLEKASSGEQRIEDVDLAALVKQCVQTTCPRYHVELDAVTLDLKPCTLKASRDDLEMIVRNLIDNAIKYAGSPPEVSVRLRHKRDGSANLAVIEVEDNGLGIPAKQRRKIFGRFVRLGVELERKLRHRPGDCILYGRWCIDCVAESRSVTDCKVRYHLRSHFPQRGNPGMGNPIPMIM